MSDKTRRLARLYRLWREPRREINAVEYVGTRTDKKITGTFVFQGACWYRTIRRGAKEKEKSKSETAVKTWSPKPCPPGRGKLRRAGSYSVFVGERDRDASQQVPLRLRTNGAGGVGQNGGGGIVVLPTSQFRMDCMLRVSSAF